jgi:hypothetical protein
VCDQLGLFDKPGHEELLPDLQELLGEEKLSAPLVDQLRAQNIPRGEFTQAQRSKPPRNFAPGEVRG